MYSAIKEHQQLLAQQYVAKTLPHAILFSGVSGVGKNALAQWLIKLLLCQRPTAENNEKVLSACGNCKTCHLYHSGSYPDHLTLLPIVKGKSKVKSKNLGVDEVRFANEFLQKTAHIGTYQTVLVENAHIMTISAANALLKTLEEPSAQSLIILVTHDADRLLPTIISRCRVLHLRSLVGEALLDSIKNSKNQVNSGASSLEEVNNTLNEIAYINSTHLAELTNQELQSQYQSFKSLLIIFLVKGDISKALAEIAIANEYAIPWLEKIIVNIARLRQTHPDETKLIANSIELNNLPSAEILNQIYKRITNSSKLTKSYVQANKQFVIEKLLVDISKLLKATNSV